MRFFSGLKGSLLVLGTSVGAGMLSLPFLMAAGGFSHTLWFFGACCLLMTLTAFLMLELVLWFPQGANLFSMAQAILGPVGRALLTITSVFFLYALLVAYLVGGSSIVQEWASHQGLTAAASMGLYALLAMGIVCLGAAWVERLNRWLMALFFIAYAILMALLVPSASLNVWQSVPMELNLFGKALPIVLTSFSFHLLMPTLRDFLNRDKKNLVLAIVLGSLLALMIYLCWIYAILGVIPIEDNGQTAVLGLRSMGAQAEPMMLLSQALERSCSGMIPFWMQFFAFFALLTSFIGVGLGLVDLWKDILSFSPYKNILSIVAAFALPLAVAFSYPNLFISALAYGGVFGALLLIIYPSWMVLQGRSRYSSPGSYRVWGGNSLPWGTLILGCFVIICFFTMS